MIVVDYCNFYENSAIYSAGCLELTSENKLSIKGNIECVFEGNKAGLNGGVLEAELEVELSFENLEFVNSVAGS